MRLDQVDLNLFIVFEVIYREQNLTRAAEVLHITQPSVSNALARLRKTFDDPLFERKSDGMKPTPLAKNIIGPVREALWRLNNSVISKDSFDPATASKIVRLSMDGFCSSLVMPKVVSLLRKDAPGLIVESFSVASSEVVNGLGSANFDLSIEPPTIKDPLLYHKSIIHDDFVCVVKPGHCFAGVSPSLEQYLKLDHITVSSREPDLDHVDYALNTLSRKRKVKVRVEDYMVASKLVLEADLILTAPRSLAETFGLPITELPFNTPPMKQHMYWHKSMDSDPTNQWLRGVVERCCDRSESGYSNND